MNLNQIINELKNAGIENARHEALVLASHFTQTSQALLMCDFDKELNSDTLNRAVWERTSRKPLQYILGEWEFMGLPFKVDENCLIPRADSELLVEAAVSRLPEYGCFLDLCTGSGCIAVTIASLKKNCRGIAVEKYKDTIKIAEENAVINKVKNQIKFIAADVTDDIFKDNPMFFDVIAANPPYVSPDEMNVLEPELKFEPPYALTDGENGLTIIENIIKIYPRYLSAGGTIAIEHGYSQGINVRDLFKAAGFSPVTLRDLSGNERVTLAQNS